MRMSSWLLLILVVQVLIKPVPGMSRQLWKGQTDHPIIVSGSGVNVVDSATHLTDIQSGGRSVTAFGGASIKLSGAGFDVTQS